MLIDANPCESEEFPHCANNRCSNHRGDVVRRRVSRQFASSGRVHFRTCRAADIGLLQQEEAEEPRNAEGFAHHLEPSDEVKALRESEFLCIEGSNAQ